MASNRSKYALLDKNQQIEDNQMIQMVDWSTIQASKSNLNNKDSGTQYVRLDDQTQKNKGDIKQSVPNQIKKTAPKVSQTQAPVYPKYSANPNPNQINMNGTNYRRQNTQEQRSSKLPQMKVACDFCTFEQNVPGNTQVYICCVCNNMNQCYPLYGLFVCGYCQCKVCYQYGTSQMIRCTRCGTINKVPFEPKRNYTKDISNQNKVNQTQHVKQKPKENNYIQKKQVKPLIDFDDEQIIIDQDNQPTRPMMQENKEKVKQQQISFDDIPLKKQKNNDNQYLDL